MFGLRGAFSAGFIDMDQKKEWSLNEDDMLQVKETYCQKRLTG